MGIKEREVVHTRKTQKYNKKNIKNRCSFAHNEKYHCLDSSDVLLIEIIAINF